MPNGTINGVSKAIEKGVPGVMGAPSVNQGGASSSVEIPAPASQGSPSSFQGALFPRVVNRSLGVPLV